MGHNGPGLSINELSEDDFLTLVEFCGPMIFKVLRISPGTVEAIREAKTSGRPTVASGGSCLITSANTRKWQNNGHLDITWLTNLINTLPTHDQIVDAVLNCNADITLDILESNLFAARVFGLATGLKEETGASLLDIIAKMGAQQARGMQTQYNVWERALGLVTAEGERHVKKLAAWNQFLGVSSDIRPAWFHELPVRKWARDFCSSNIRRNFEFLDRLVVLWSFTGHWVQMLKEHGVIPADSVYFACEPFHHMTEMTSQWEGNKSTIGRSFNQFGQIFDQYPYGMPGLNEQIAGAISFLPALNTDGRMCWATADYTTAISSRTIQDRLAIYDAETKKPAPLRQSQLWADSVNFLVWDQASRERIIQLVEIDEEVDRQVEEEFRAQKGRIKKVKMRRRRELRQERNPQIFEAQFGLFDELTSCLELLLVE